MVFEEYAGFYDLYYADKDYAAEVDFVLRLVKRFNCSPGSVLDMGCGTGRHIAEFLKHGLKCDGFDLSRDMLARAKERLAGEDVSLIHAGLADFSNDKQYDLIVSMFAVMGYLTENSELLAGLKTAGKHLASDGVLVFDGWFGPAVLAGRPEERRHEYPDGEDLVVRTASPTLDPVAQLVDVRYEIAVERDGSVRKRIAENHRMRFMFVREMAAFMQQAGLEMIHACPFLEPEEELTTETWNVCFVAKKIIVHGCS